MNKFLLTGALLAGLTAGVLGQQKPDLEALVHTLAPSREVVVDTYLNTKQEIRAKHEEYISNYKNAQTQEEKNKIKDEAKNYVTEQMLGEIMPAWEGTDWTFNGCSHFPQRGSIACGWYVQRVLEHLDFDFEKKHTRRPYFAQNWPVEMTEGIDKKGALEVKYERNSTDEKLKAMPEGVYLIGFSFDNTHPGTHVGFLVNTKENLHVLHSLGTVENVPAHEEAFYTGARKLYIANVFNDDVMKNWLEDTPIKW